MNDEQRKKLTGVWICVAFDVVVGVVGAPLVSPGDTRAWSLPLLIAAGTAWYAISLRRKFLSGAAI